MARTRLQLNIVYAYATCSRRLSPLLGANYVGTCVDVLRSPLAALYKYIFDVTHTHAHAACVAMDGERTGDG